MSKHKKQHFVPAGYLKAWCDPNAPTTHTPYVWLFNRDGSNARKKSPENILHERDMYTIHGPDGSRDLVLEDGLSRLETEFTKIRDSRIYLRRPLSDAEHLSLCAFIAAAQVRTPSSRDHHQRQWGAALKVMEERMKWAKTATPKQKRRAAAMSIPSTKSKRRLTYEQVKQLHDHPLQTTLYPMILTARRLFYQLDLAILVTGDEIGFITSDSPCVVFDPESCKRPPLFQFPALMYEAIEISLPISPSHCLLLNRQGLSGYTDISQGVVDDLNRRVRFYAEKYFVVRKDAKRDCWFDPGVEPDDSWDKLHAPAAGSPSV